MKQNLFTIDDKERKRILEMHQSATKKQYLTEQVDNTWPEKQATFSGGTEQEISTANISYLGDYYGVQVDATTVNPDNLIGKTAYFFNYNNNPLTTYMLSNLNPNNFVIKDILYNPNGDSLYLLGNTYPAAAGQTIYPAIRIGGGNPTEVNIKPLEIEKKYKGGYLPTKMFIKEFYYFNTDNSKIDHQVNSVFTQIKYNYTWKGSKYDKEVRDAANKNQ